MRTFKGSSATLNRGHPHVCLLHAHRTRMQSRTHVDADDETAHHWRGARVGGGVVVSYVIRIDYKWFGVRSGCV